MALKQYLKLQGRTKEMGLTQKAVAKYAGIAESTYSQKLNGKQPFKQSEMRKIADLLKIDALEIDTYFFG